MNIVKFEIAVDQTEGATIESVREELINALAGMNKEIVMPMHMTQLLPEDVDV